MMRLNLQLSMGTFSLTLFGLVGVAFGMNLSSCFEEVSLSTLKVIFAVHVVTLLKTPAAFLIWQILNTGGFRWHWDRFNFTFHYLIYCRQLERSEMCLTAERFMAFLKVTTQVVILSLLLSPRTLVFSGWSQASCS